MKRVLFGAWVTVVAVGCFQREPPPTAEEQAFEHPLAGLYTPGSEIGLTAETKAFIAAQKAMMAGSGALSEEEMTLMSLMQMNANSDRCMPLGGTPGTPGTLKIEFTTAQYGGKYVPKNCGAVWIEDPAGKYIATPELWARIRIRPLFFWSTQRCGTDPPDAVTSATLDTHELHSVTWDGHDFTGEIAPDGMYVLNIEVTEDETKVGRRSQFPFVKGANPELQTPPDTDTVKGLKLEYTPEPTTPGGEDDPATGS